MQTRQPNSSHGHKDKRFGFLILAFVPIALLATMGLLPAIRQHPVLGPSFWIWTGLLLVWLVWLAYTVNRDNRRLLIEFAPRKQHYIQALVQLSLFVYWGWYWRQIYENAPLIAAQLVFAYAFDMLLCWSRREKYALGFGPLPIIFSTNFFLLFREDWFYLQFLMVAVGFLGKEFVRWRRDGRQTHIFNPSAFSLGLFSLGLILTGTTDLTWGASFATTLTLAPNIYLVIFMLGLVVMFYFNTTLVSAAAAATMFGLSALYFSFTGVPYFIDSEIPAAVFLGLHLLVTDPSTSPRTPLGKAIFGMGYGLGSFALYELLGRFGVPTFYDKLLCVPLLNLSVQAIDHLVKSSFRVRWVEQFGLQTATTTSNRVHMVIWVAFFASIASIGGTDGKHTGDSVPFWQQACSEGRFRACERLLQIHSGYCADGVRWACNELAVDYAEGIIVPRDPQRSQAYLDRACRLGSWTGCANLRGLNRGLRQMQPGSLSRDMPQVQDLRALLREGGQNLLTMPEQELYVRACGHGWTFACAKVTRASR